MIKERLGALLIKAFAAGFKRFPETVKVSPKTVRSKADTVGFKSYTKSPKSANTREVVTSRLFNLMEPLLPAILPIGFGIFLILNDFFEVTLPSSKVATTVNEIPDIKNIIIVPGHGEMVREKAKALPEADLVSIAEQIPADTVATITERLTYTYQRVADAKTQILLKTTGCNVRQALIAEDFVKTKCSRTQSLKNSSRSRPAGLNR